MTAFEVPGWNVQANPVQENGTTPSKKRKRSGTDDHQALEVNFDKIMEKLKSTVGGDEKDNRKRKNLPKKNKRERQKLKERSKSNTADATALNISRPKPLKPRISVDNDLARPAKKANTRESISPSTIASTLTFSSSTSSGLKLTALQQGMKQNLDGAKFRMINETLYKSNSTEAHQLLQDDPKVFEQYHIGFRHQVQSWPTNPVEHYITVLASYPPRTVIADFGCGDAALAKALMPRGLNVLSYDFVSDGEYVIEADVCKRIPLPGSEESSKDQKNSSAQVVDVVVCALSLMGTNWPRCIREAWRILKPEGELKIAEVTSRFTNVEEFQSLVGSIGFRFKSRDQSNSHFTLFEFKKSTRKPRSDREWARLVSGGDLLKPCEYKRR